MLAVIFLSLLLIVCLTYPKQAIKTLRLLQYCICAIICLGILAFLTYRYSTKERTILFQVNGSDNYYKVVDRPRKNQLFVLISKDIHSLYKCDDPCDSLDYILYNRVYEDDIIYPEVFFTWKKDAPDTLLYDDRSYYQHSLHIPMKRRDESSGTPFFYASPKLLLLYTCFDCEITVLNRHRALSIKKS